MQDLEALSLQQLRELRAGVVAEIERKERIVKAAGRRAAFASLRDGRACDWCGEEDGTDPVYSLGVFTGHYVGRDCVSRKAFVLAPERWRQIVGIA